MSTRWKLWLGASALALVSGALLAAQIPSPMIGGQLGLDLIRGAQAQESGEGTGAAAECAPEGGEGEEGGAADCPAPAGEDGEVRAKAADALSEDANLSKGRPVGRLFLWP